LLSEGVQMIRFTFTSILSIASLSLLLLGFQANQPVPQVFASGSPCDAVINAPNPPSVPAEPTFGGTITDAADDSGISGVSLKLYKCTASAATLFSSIQTDSSGDYLFTHLDAGYYYYLEAELTGSLSGMSAATGTLNPTDAIGLSPSASDVDLSFED
jgi:hypothetical protein